MKYVALLRGINVGGNAMIKMVDLASAFEKSGYKNVKTYINSGNVIFESDKTNAQSIRNNLEEVLSVTFKLSLRIFVISHDQLKKVLEDVPSDWKKKNDIRCYIAFVLEPKTEKDVLQEIELHEGLDFASSGPGVVYMTTLLSGLIKSKFSKLAGKKIYKDITIRNYTTCQKLLSLMG